LLLRRERLLPSFQAKRKMLNPDPFKIQIDPGTGFATIGQGSAGGKAQGLGLVRSLLNGAKGLKERYAQVEFAIPETLVVAANGFDSFLRENNLEHLVHAEMPDDEVAGLFLNGRLPEKLLEALSDYLEKVHFPLAVRSSGMLEDLHYHAYAGLYRTYMLSNDQPELEQRLDRLVEALKLVFASTFFEGPRAYAKRVGHQLEACSMAAIIQQVAGSRHGGHFYPAISGVAQSRNHYPIGGMKAEDGLATIALGLGKQVVSGERALRFCPKYPKRLVQRSSVEEVLDFAQRGFWAVELGTQVSWRRQRRDHVVQRLVSDAVEEPPVQMLAGTYVPAEHRIRDTIRSEGRRVLTFANVLKYDLFPLAVILRDILALGEQSLDAAVEIEFAVDLTAGRSLKHQFYLLQMRPMTARQEGLEVTITAAEQDQALCYCQNTMGNVQRLEICDIVYIKPDAFDPGRTRDMVRHVAEINAALVRLQRQYLLVGPGRWGSADPWLGIPVRWADISNVAAIVETASDALRAEPSQGAHFFHNMASLGICYFSLAPRPPDFFDWNWLKAQAITRDNDFAAHVRLSKPLILKVDGRTSSGIITLES
jgi:Pyruvate phosphate dikinase, AMP/ATP-binding domain